MTSYFIWYPQTGVTENLEYEEAKYKNEKNVLAEYFIYNNFFYYISRRETLAAG